MCVDNIDNLLPASVPGASSWWWCRSKSIWLPSSKLGRLFGPPPPPLNRGGGAWKTGCDRVGWPGWLPPPPENCCCLVGLFDCCGGSGPSGNRFRGILSGCRCLANKLTTSFAIYRDQSVNQWDNCHQQMFSVRVKLTGNDSTLIWLSWPSAPDLSIDDDESSTMSSIDRWCGDVWQATFCSAEEQRGIERSE